MPPKERERLEFEFTHNGRIYYFDNYYITEDGKYVCRCDLTATNYYGNKEVMLICCKIALDAYLESKEQAERDVKQEICKVLGVYKEN